MRQDQHLKQEITKLLTEFTSLAMSLDPLDYESLHYPSFKRV
jgi:hypothetical protein